MLYALDEINQSETLLPNIRYIFFLLYMQNICYCCSSMHYYYFIYLFILLFIIFRLGALILDTCSNPSYALEQENKPNNCGRTLSYSVLQSDGNSFCGDVVLDNVNMA